MQTVENKHSKVSARCKLYIDIYLHLALNVTVVRTSPQGSYCGGDGVNVGKICGNAIRRGIFIENGGLSGGKGGDVEGNGYFATG